MMKFKRGDVSERPDLVVGRGEPVVCTKTWKLYIADGVSTLAELEPVGYWPECLREEYLDLENAKNDNKKRRLFR